MATGDGINKAGSYATVQVAASVANGAMSGGNVTDIATAIPAEKDYFLLDFRVDVTVTAPSVNTTIDIYRRPAATAPVPSATYKEQYVGSVVLAAATGSYYLRGVPNPQPTDTFYCWNASGVTTTIALLARGRTYISAP